MQRAFYCFTEAVERNKSARGQSAENVSKNQFGHWPSLMHFVLIRVHSWPEKGFNTYHVHDTFALQPKMQAGRMLRT